jgi:NAD-dependent deacetylase
MADVFVLTGAGISAESGIPVFQGTSWRGYSHYQLANIEAWRANPQLVWKYYSHRRATARQAKPNPAHRALAEFEKSARGRFFLCTQNVDGLHEAAGSGEVVHIHGKLFESRCSADCGRSASADESCWTTENLPHCDCGELLRPNVCWFGERPYDLERVFRELELSDCFLAIGTSGSVEPVASFVGMLKGRNRKTRTVYIGLEEPSNAGHFDEIYLGLASLLVPQILAELTNQAGQLT